MLADAHRRLIDALYLEAMLLADEARSYFDHLGKAERDALPPMQRVGFSCEALRVTTRLMHVIAWLLTRRAMAAGEISAAEGAAPERRLGEAPTSDPDAVAALPEAAQTIVAASIELHARVRRLDERLVRGSAPASPARGLLDRLERAF